MTDADLKAAAELADKATPGPWEHRGDEITATHPDGSGWSVGHTLDSEDAAFIAASRTLIPQLLAEVDRLTKERDEWRDACQAISDLFDPLHHKALPHSALLTARAAKEAHLNVRAHRDLALAQIARLEESLRIAAIAREGGCDV